jgi:hypothetical protein
MNCGAVRCNVRNFFFSVRDRISRSLGRSNEDERVGTGSLASEGFGGLQEEGREAAQPEIQVLCGVSLLY